MSTVTQRTDDLLMDPEATAEMLGISAAQVRKMARQRELPALRLGKFWRFRKSSIESWIADHERAAR